MPTTIHSLGEVRTATEESANPYPTTPVGAKKYTGSEPQITTSVRLGYGHLEIPLGAPSWITLWAYREVKRLGWMLVDPDEWYEEDDLVARMRIIPQSQPTN